MVMTEPMKTNQWKDLFDQLGHNDTHTNTAVLWLLHKRASRVPYIKKEQALDIMYKLL